ncbi:ABC transporter substrate-binding protein [Vibrio algarum]|uniref:ABC transporter substrate-binding protein n=1 Tax=Vibrio algarum TaxID=3020714 RepID=A0ABT4YRQ8_9VIBR|nr:ABC transporter substrate-binding protein [Vibrio sp. KJ40-1]MDB1124239.1 ABC transporter substrate-binding protein [Vibrio sp. KJ40-1]
MKIRLLALLLVASHSVQADEGCGEVTIADMNWTSASLMANVDLFILEQGFGCKASLVPGDTTPTSTSMLEKGEPDIAPEMWTNATKKLLDQGVVDKKIRYGGASLSDGGEEGLWVPKYLVDQYPEMATIEGVIKHADLFKHPENPDVSAIYGCPAGWNCQISVTNLFRALKLEEAGFDLIDPGSSAGLSGALAKANIRKEAWFGYYWAPTAIFGRYEMVKVDFGSGIDIEEFLTCTTIDDCESPKVTMYPPSTVATIITETFASREPQITDYLNKRSFTNKEMSVLLAWMEENQADGEGAMEYFISEYPEIWRKWLTPEVADKVASAL